ncbi:unnamed protein product [Merluccius merluccius]
MLESYVRGYLYEPQYSDEQLRLMEAEEQEAATAAACRDKRTSDCKAIRLKYPASDGRYCGHQEAEDAQEEL